MPSGQVVREEQMRRLEALLRRPMLWPEDVVAIRALSRALDVPVVFWRLDLNDLAGWKRIDGYV